jgi:5-formyltetrahydrofolate cyclo-ligase
MTMSMPSFEPSRDKKSLRRQLQAERQTLIDRHQRAMQLQEVLRAWLIERPRSRDRRLLAHQGRV